MKRQAQPQMGGRSLVDVKRDELKKLVSDSLTQLNTTMQQTPAANITEQLNTQLTNIVQNLSREIDTKLNEIKSLQVAPAATQPGGMTQSQADDGATRSAYYQGGGGVNKPTPKKRKYKGKTPPHPTPRDKEHNKDLPDFWRRNYDYGESPYMNLEKLEKITDKPPYKKKRRKKK